MSQRILSSSSLPLRQRSDKPPWCECAPRSVRAKAVGREGDLGSQQGQETSLPENSCFILLLYWIRCNLGIALILLIVQCKARTSISRESIFLSLVLTLTQHPETVCVRNQEEQTEAGIVPS